MRRTILLAILIVPVLAACGTAPPRLAAGLQGSNKPGDYPEWHQRVRQRFPPGSDEQKLVTELRRQHFDFNPTQAGRASFRSSDLVCAQTWAVKWAARDGLITNIAGEHSAACL